MFKLPPQMIINNVESTYAQLTELMSSGEAVVLDISDVEKADTAGLQLLCVIQNNLNKTGHSISWQGRSEPLTDTAKLIGVNNFLDL